MGAQKAVVAAPLGAAVATIIVYVINQVIETPLPEAVVGAINAVVIAVAVYFIPNKEKVSK